MSEQNSPTSEGRKSEIIGLNRNSEDGDDASDRDKEGELVKLDYDIETSQGERALKVASKKKLHFSAFTPRSSYSETLQWVNPNWLKDSFLMDTLLSNCPPTPSPCTGT